MPQSWGASNLEELHVRGAYRAALTARASPVSRDQLRSGRCRAAERKARLAHEGEVGPLMAGTRNAMRTFHSPLAMHEDAPDFGASNGDEMAGLLEPPVHMQSRQLTYLAE